MNDVDGFFCFCMKGYTGKRCESKSSIRIFYFSGAMEGSRDGLDPLVEIMRVFRGAWSFFIAGERGKVYSYPKKKNAAALYRLSLSSGTSIYTAVASKLLS